MTICGSTSTGVYPGGLLPPRGPFLFPAFSCPCCFLPFFRPCSPDRFPFKGFGFVFAMSKFGCFSDLNLLTEPELTLDKQQGAQPRDKRRLLCTMPSSGAQVLQRT